MTGLRPSVRSHLVARSGLALGSLFLLACVVMLAAAPANAGHADLARAFAAPPPEYRAWVFWPWIDGNISQEGITADLEAMDRVGIGGAIIFDISQDIPRGPIRFMSPEWRECFRHTIHEAARLGLKIGVHNGPGYCTSGGPWVTPELSMQQLVYAKTNVTGPTRFHGRIPQVNKGDRPTWDVGLIAFPAVAGEGGPVPGFEPRVSLSTGASVAISVLTDNAISTFVTLPPPTGRKPQYLQMEFKEPFAASRLSLTFTDAAQHQGILQVSDNGRSFRKVREFAAFGQNVEVTFPATVSRYFRILFTATTINAQAIDLAELSLSPIYRIPQHNTKAGLGRLQPQTRDPGTRMIPTEGTIPPHQVMDLSSKVDSEGHFVWDVPEGVWTLMQVSYMPTGRKNHPAQVEATGFEIDKLNKQAVEAHFGAFLANLIADAGPETGHTLDLVFIDSWEVGFQNWTAAFRQEFQRLRQYDPLPWLPAFSGTYVGDTSLSERFLWDVRKTISELLAEDYAGHLAHLARKHNLELAIEAYGQGPFASLTYAGRAELPMGEFWVDEADYPYWHFPKTMASAAHVYGRRIVPAEAFAAWPKTGKWQQHPGALKILGDAIFCSGVNRMVFNHYAHQPWLDRAPGMTMGHWGVHYGRTATWWEFSRDWHDYLARCQFLLQQGTFVADLCYLTTEEGFAEPPSVSELQPPLPPGFDYDIAPPEVAFTRMRVESGCLVLPDGMSYRLLVLPPSQFMTPDLLAKIHELVVAGATVYGPPPTNSPSLTAYPDCDSQVRKLTAELWGPCDGKGVLEHRLGHGRMIWGKPLLQVLGDLGIVPDFEPAPGAPPLRWIHRRIDDADVYFVANPTNQPASGSYRFRAAGRRPEFWDAETGTMEVAATWQEANGITTLPIELGPGGSLFVVFQTTSATADPLLPIIHEEFSTRALKIRARTNGNLQINTGENGTFSLKHTSGKTRQIVIESLPAPIEVPGPWKIGFPRNLGAPPSIQIDKLISWTSHPNPGVKYFSGTATYETRFSLPSNWLQSNRRLLLDLGRVQVIARASVNAKPIGNLWKAPFRADITEAAVPGENHLQVEVVNLWPNRLTGDEVLHADDRWKTPDGDIGVGLREWPRFFLEGKPDPSDRVTFTTWKHWRKDSQLLESGLLGPVTIRLEHQFVLE